MKLRSPRTYRISVFTITSVLLVTSVGAILASPLSSSAATKKKHEVTTLRYEPFPTILNFPELAQSLGYLKGLTLVDEGEERLAGICGNMVTTGRSYTRPLRDWRY